MLLLHFIHWTLLNQKFITARISDKVNSNKINFQNCPPLLYFGPLRVWWQPLWSNNLNLGISFLIISNVQCLIGFSSFQLLYVIDTTSQTYVEECINWQEKSTLIVSMTISCFPPRSQFKFMTTLYWLNNSKIFSNCLVQKLHFHSTIFCSTELLEYFGILCNIVPIYSDSRP